MTGEFDLATYNPSCVHYDEWLGVCGHPEGRLMACREQICPEKHKLTDEQLKELYKGD